tara:strand:+ start:636 stop:1478 length:843 start_codon:yes stop_codon:yes gene_type:complete
MVNGISNSVRNFQLSVESYQSQELQQKTGDDSVKETFLNESLAFEMNLSKSMQVVEGESKRSVTKSLSLEFSLNFENNRVMMEKSQVPKGEDMFSPENTANRIVDFIKSAFKFSQLFGENKLETEEDRLNFQETQTGAVEDGFKQARGLLGELPEDIESGISKTFDLIMEGLDKFFGGAEESVEEPTESLNPANGNYYSSQSFSLSYQLEVNAQGNFANEELQEFMSDRMGQVQNAFQDFLDSLGVNENTDSNQNKTFNPLGLFQLNALNTDKIQGLLQE